MNWACGILHRLNQLIGVLTKVLRHSLYCSSSILATFTKTNSSTVFYLLWTRAAELLHDPALCTLAGTNDFLVLISPFTYFQCALGESMDLTSGSVDSISSRTSLASSCMYDCNGSRSMFLPVGPNLQRDILVVSATFRCTSWLCYPFSLLLLWGFHTLSVTTLCTSLGVGSRQAI